MYCKESPEGVILCVRLQPRSSKCKIAGVVGQCLKVCVNASPVEGAANKACCDFLSRFFGIAKGRVEIISGAKSREKRILLRGLDKETVVSLLSELP
jgi:uncharacterized protein (TIGR00251 family)